MRLTPLLPWGGTGMARWASLCALAATLAGCGGGNPVGNPPDVRNLGAADGGEGQALSFVYFQLCVYPALTTSFVPAGGGTATCGASGCHLSTNSSGGSLKIAASAAPAASSTASTVDASGSASPMYQSFYSAQAVVDFNSRSRSKLLAKPRVDGTLHGGGLLFNGTQELESLLQRWIDNPVVVDDEFSMNGAVRNMFVPPLDVSGALPTALPSGTGCLPP